MAVADHIIKKDPPPPELKQALNYQAWGIGDIMVLPAGLLPKMNTVLSYYRAFTAWQSAAGQGNVAGWSKANPQAWDLVTRVLQEKRSGDRNK